MSDGSLSQDEIDALLQGGGGGMDFGGGSPQAEKGLDLTPKEKQDIISLLSSVVSSQSSNLSSMVGQPVQMGRPAVEVKGKDDITGDLSDEIVEIKIDYDDGINGEHIFVFPSDVATTIASQMMGQQDVELSDAAVSALEEAGNTLSGSAVTIIGDKIGRTIMTSPGQSRKIMKEELGIGDGNYVKVSYPSPSTMPSPLKSSRSLPFPW
jgi:flagellar motor switch protein FliN/FliY